MTTNLGCHKLFCAEIENHNCEGMCSQAWCSKPQVEYTRVIINGIDIFLPLCSDHAREIEKTGFNNWFWGEPKPKSEIVGNVGNVCNVCDQAKFAKLEKEICSIKRVVVDG